MKTIVHKKKQIIGLIYGLAAGLAFAIFAWGIDGFLLASANGAYPWIKFIPGLLISIFTGGFVGWLSVVLSKGIFAIILWLGFSLLLSWLIFWLPIRATPYIIGMTNDYLGNYLNYPFYKDMQQIQWFAFAIIAILAIICALLENLLIDQALFSAGNLSFLVPVLVSFVCFSLAGNATDGMYNRHVREPIQNVDHLIQFVLDHANQEIPAETERVMHTGALNGVAKYISNERSLILSNFDQSFGQIDVLINFSGHWVKCTTIYNQVTFCKEAINTPKSLLPRFTTMSSKGLAKNPGKGV